MISDQLKASIKAEADAADDLMDFMNELRVWLAKDVSPRHDQPIDVVRWVPLDQVQANDYNPNSVAMNEMRLLYVSISHDGYTQPVVTFWDEDLKKYVIVDGFHRYTTMRLNQDLKDGNGGRLPVVVIDKDINDRMASTVRHNRARGKHSISGMGNIVFSMLQNGASDEDICTEVGLEPEELARLKHVTGFAKLFKDTEYSQAWELDKQTRLRKKYHDSQKESA